MTEEFKTIARFSDPMVAEITAGMLRSNGIPAEVFGETSSYPSISYEKVEVKVNVEDYEAAMALLKENEKVDATLED